jgi:hypothetical protein
MPHGSPITCGFVVGDSLIAVEEELRRWPKMTLPKNAMVVELQSEEIGVHFVQDNNKTGGDSSG